MALALLLLLAPHRVQAAPPDIEWETQKQLDLDASPLEIAVSADGEWIYILSFNEVLVYWRPEYKIIKRIPVEEGFDSIAFSPKDNALVLTNSFTSVLKIIHLDVLHEIPIADSPFKGPEDAPIVIITFTDFQCPYCAQFSPVLESVQQAYPNHVKLVHKNFPLAMHKFARRAAAASVAAQRQGRFWEFHDRLFESSNQLSDEKIMQIAEELGLDLEQFKRDMDDPAVQQGIMQDIRDGYHAGVRGTPSVFVNGKLLSSQKRTFAGFQEIIKRKFPELEPVKTEEKEPQEPTPVGDKKPAPVKEQQPQTQQAAPPAQPLSEEGE